MSRRKMWELEAGSVERVASSPITPERGSLPDRGLQLREGRGRRASRCVEGPQASLCAWPLSRTWELAVLMGALCP